MSELYVPVCKDTAVHRAHLHWHGPGRALAVQCDGYTPEQHDITALVTRIETMVKEGRVPPGTVLQCGPAVLTAVRRNVVPDFPSLTEPRALPDSKIMVSVQVVTTLGPRDWRLVLDYGVIGEDDHGLV